MLDATSKVSNPLRALREGLGLTQQELADRSGVHVLTVGRLERDLSSSTVDTLSKLASALGVPTAALLPR